MFYAFLGGLGLGIGGTVVLYNFYKMKNGVSLQLNTDATVDGTKDGGGKT